MPILLTRTHISWLGEDLDIPPLFRKLSLNFFAGVDNALNAKYSLGNDINAAGGRYYNAAATANYFIGLSVNFNKPLKIKIPQDLLKHSLHLCHLVPALRG